MLNVTRAIAIAKGREDIGSKSVTTLLFMTVVLVLLMRTQAGAVTVEDIILHMDPNGNIKNNTLFNAHINIPAYDPDSLHYNEELSRKVLTCLKTMFQPQ